MPLRALVTGFLDWRTLVPAGNPWCCRENPSGRLLLGPAHLEPRPPAPEQHERGPLAPRLRARRPDVAWTFATLPVRWEIGDAIDWGAYDLVVNLGLGVYDSFERLQLERGAINLCDGRPDVDGRARTGPIDPAAPPRLDLPDSLDHVFADMSSETYGAYACVVAGARADNAFICNDTHFRGLRALARGTGRLRAAAFVHLPYPREHDDARLPELADAVAGLIARLAAGLGVTPARP